MKVYVSYDVTFELDVPKEEIEQALTFNNRGKALRDLAEKYRPTITESLNIADTADLTGFYQDWTSVEGGGYALQAEDLGDVIWEE